MACLGSAGIQRRLSVWIKTGFGKMSGSAAFSRFTALWLYSARVSDIFMLANVPARRKGFVSGVGCTARTQIES